MISDGSLCRRRMDELRSWWGSRQLDRRVKTIMLISPWTQATPNVQLLQLPHHITVMSSLSIFSHSTKLSLDTPV